MLHPKQQHIVDIYGKEPQSLDEIAESCIAVISHSAKVPVVGFAWKFKYQRKVSNSHKAPIAHRTNWAGRDNNGPRDFPGLYGRVWIRFAERAEFMNMSNDFDKTLTYTGTGGGGSYDGLWTPISTASFQTRKRVTDSSRIHGFRYDYEYPDPECFSWDYRLFLQDFSGLNEVLTNEIIAFELDQDKKESWHKLKGKYYSRDKFYFSHRFKWEDAATKAADDKFLKEYNKTLKQEQELA